MVSTSRLQYGQYLRNACTEPPPSALCSAGLVFPKFQGFLKTPDWDAAAAAAAAPPAAFNEPDPPGLEPPDLSNETAEIEEEAVDGEGSRTEAELAASLLRDWGAGVSENALELPTIVSLLKLVVLLTPMI